MKLRTLALAALATASFGAQAALTTYAPFNAALPNLNGVLFNVQTVDGVTVALGAHAYKNGVFLPNNGTDTYYAQNGTYTGESNRANWSFDFAWNLGTNCAGCSVALLADKDPTAGVNLVELFATTPGQTTPLVYSESWNMEMAFINDLLGYNFNPFAPSSTAFELVVRNANGGTIVGSDITVNVPEPGTVALLGLAFAGLGFSRRSKIAK